MLQQVGYALTARAYFKSGKTGKTGLTVTVDVWAPDGSALVTAGACTEIGDGLYQRVLAVGSVTTVGEYTFVFKTTDATVNQKEVATSYSVGYDWLGRIDAAVTTRLATTGYTVPPTVDAIADEVWDEPKADHAAVGSLGANLDAAVSTRLATTGYTVPPTVDAIADEVWDEPKADHAAAGSMGANLDAAVSTRLATTGYTAPNNASIATILGRADVNTSTRLAALDYTAPDNADIATILGRTDVATSTRLADADFSEGAIADAVWDEPIDAHATPGTEGQLLADTYAITLAAVAPDNTGIATLLDRLTSGRAALLDNLSLLDVAISTRLATTGYTAPDNADIATILTRTDVVTSSRLATVGYTAPDNAGIAAIEADVDVAVSSRLAAVDYTAPDNATISDIQDDTDTLMVRLSAARANLLDSLTLLSQLGTVNDRLAAILALPDIQAALSARVPASITDDIEGYTLGDSVTLDRALLGIPSGDAVVRVWLTVKAHLADLDSAALLQLYVTDTDDHDAGRITDNGLSTGTGSVSFTLSPANTLAIGLGRRHYDISGLTDGGAIRTFYRGLLTLYPQVTIASS